MARFIARGLYQGKLAALLILLALSNLGTDHEEYPFFYDPDCEEECENLAEDITFVPESLSLREAESKTTKATFSGGEAFWDLSPVPDWLTWEFVGSSQGVNSTTIRLEADPIIPERIGQIVNSYTEWQVGVTANPPGLGIPRFRWLEVKGYPPKIGYVSVFFNAEKPRRVHVIVVNAPESSKWQFGVADLGDLIFVDINQIDDTSASITLQAPAPPAQPRCRPTGTDLCWFSIPSFTVSATRQGGVLRKITRPVQASRAIKKPAG